MAMFNVAKRFLLNVCFFGGIQVLAMEYTAEQLEDIRKADMREAERVVEDRKVFLWNKIDQYQKKVNNTLSIEDKIGYQKILNTWVVELNGLHQLINLKGVIAVGDFLDAELNKTGTKNQRFFEKK